MAFAVEKLQSVTECDALLNELEFEIRAVNLRLEGLDFRNDKVERSSASTSALIAQLEARLANLDNQLAVMAEGMEKMEAEIERQEVDVRLKRLRFNNGVSGAVTFVKREGDIFILEANREAINTFRAAVEARKLELV